MIFFYIFVCFLILEMFRMIQTLNNELSTKKSNKSFLHKTHVQQVPINIRTRGEREKYKQIGTLHEVNPNTTNPVILPLYGARTYSGSSKWLYYTYTDQFNKVKLPVYNTKQRNCQNEYGCDELYDNDQITINAYSSQFMVQLYVKTEFRYIPQINNTYRY